MVFINIASKIAFFPGEVLYHWTKEERTKTEVTITAIAVANFYTIASYYIPLTYTFSYASSKIICEGQKRAYYKDKKLGQHERNSSLINLRILIVAFSIFVGGKIGQIARECAHPITPPLPLYSISWKTPFHILNNLYIPLLIGVVFIRLKKLDVDKAPPVFLPKFQPKSLEPTLKNPHLRDIERNDLVKRIEQVKAFKISSTQPDDDISAAHYTLLSDPSWASDEIKMNYKALALYTHPDKIPSLDRKYFDHVHKAFDLLNKEQQSNTEMEARIVLRSSGSHARLTIFS